ncbi:Fe-S-cluster-containing dehydrogenase component [Anaerosolibacter carboniphilus]|uniref:Fe-S-cluster-containing dehydrogenase component n=1 Tax=Anaerosolibacter carboniphilus TaxID=1417629 RepID=A0A841KUG7_9FIRM|nr:4Fe-4S dicluster domain-containing protein [Anaerosolibacter carboniphilus]MBB6215660.1 Fe-S-cluster-containing dehydrogenase component [Anaerosolibacter carboniphilus]
MKKNRQKILKAIDMSKCIGCSSCMLACARNVHGDYSPIKSAIRIQSSGGFQGRFVANICRGCIHPACAAACRTGALMQRDGGGVQLVQEKCIGCKKCISACIVQGIAFDDQKHIPIVCLQCGQCTKSCPHSVLSMEVNDAFYERSY